MSFPQDRFCPFPKCKFNTHPVKADSAQTKEHLGYYHGFKNILKTVKSLNLIEEYARPTREGLLEILANHSLIRSDSHVC